jgi:hypothetical protein
MRKTTRWLVTMAAPAALGAQMPGVPVFQNAWATPGVVGAVDLSGGSGSTVWAGAVSFAPTGGRVQLSGGFGSQSTTGQGSRGVYGIRLATSIAQLMGGKIGLGAFAGIGGGGKSTRDSSLTTSLLPIGIAIGFRQPIGTTGTHGFSAYLTPSFQRATASVGSSSSFRVATGLDVGLSKNFGLTAGIEFGKAVAAGHAGPRGSLYGVGASYAFGKR